MAGSWHGRYFFYHWLWVTKSCTKFGCSRTPRKANAHKSFIVLQCMWKEPAPFYFFSAAIDFPSPITRFWKIPSSGVWQSVQWNFSWGAGVRSDCRCQRWDGIQLDQTGVLLFCLIWEFIQLLHPSWKIHNPKNLQPDPMCHIRPLSWTLERPSGKETFNPCSLHRLFSLLCRHVGQRLLLRRALRGVPLVWKHLGLVRILRYLPHRLLWIFGGHDLSRNKVSWTSR